jgi:hypothetical protein
MHIGNTSEKEIKELDPRKAYKNLGIEENFDIQHYYYYYYYYYNRGGVWTGVLSEFMKRTKF